jgi:17beta-estradiol 17-dehydrogenase / very-long-chain 3-oxoacyl-CoA reductase
MFVYDLIRVFVLPRWSSRLGVDLRTLGSWAVVTGATDGIGLEYARQLAQKAQLNIVLISRSQEKLDRVAREIERESNVTTKCIAVDFTRGREIYDEISTQLADLDIAILVNNVGINTPSADYFGNHADDKIMSDIINVNCGAVTLMTKLLLPRMLEKNKGMIVNMSSMAAHGVAPLALMYGATKAYISSFSRSIEYECKLRSSSVIIQTIEPSFISTKLAAGYRLPLTPDSRGFVASALLTVGRQTETFGSVWFTIMGSVVDKLPTWLQKKVAITLYGNLREGQLLLAVADNVKKVS